LGSFGISFDELKPSVSKFDGQKPKIVDFEPFIGLVVDLDRDRSRICHGWFGTCYVGNVENNPFL